MEIGTLLHSNTVVLGMILSSVMQALVGETQKSFLCLLVLIGYQFNDRNIFPSLMAADHRFPFGELTILKKPVEENKDAGETEDADSDDDDGDAGEEENDDRDDGSDYEGEDFDDDAEANSDSDSDDDDDHDDDDDDDDDDEEDEEDDDQDDDNDDSEVDNDNVEDKKEEFKGLPSKRKK